MYKASRFIIKNNGNGIKTNINGNIYYIIYNYNGNANEV